MPDKQFFLQSINSNTVYDTEFFKKVYGYAACDDLFLGEVASKLFKIGQKEAIQAYNSWYVEWKKNDEQQMKKVAQWYHKECEKQFEAWAKSASEGVIKEWEPKEIELLQRKKLLLLTKKLMQSTER